MKKDRVSIRLPEELQNYEAFGFKTISEYIKTALVEFNEKQELEVIKANSIIDSMIELLKIMDLEKGDSDEPSEKDTLVVSLEKAVTIIAKSEFMLNSPINNQALDHAGEKCYRHRHWVAD